VNNVFSRGRRIWTFSRSQDNPAALKVHEVDDFRPYFYVPDPAGKFKSLFGESLSKITCSKPMDLREKRDFYPQHFEADVRYVNRYLVDRGDTDTSEPFRFLFLDIETDSTKVPNPKTDAKKYPVSVIGLYDSILGYLTFCWHPTYTTTDDTMFVLRSEQDMLEAFCEYLRLNLPDAILAWNGEGFDFPYLFNRYGIEAFRKVSPIKEVTEDEYRSTIAGTSFLDYLLLYKKIISTASKAIDSYALGNIGMIECGIPKLEFPDNADFGQMLTYNRRDVEIMVKIEERLRIAQYYNRLHKVTRTQYDSVLFNTRMVDQLLLYTAQKRNVVLPSRKSIESTEKFAGGFVRIPAVGMHEWVVVFDFSSLYPNIMRTFNLSPETLVQTGGIAVNDLHFAQEPQGIIPVICSTFMMMRDDVNEQKKQHDVGSSEYKRLDDEYAALKSLTNSVFGYTGYKDSRLYSREVASTITFVGRELIGYVEKEVGLNIIYADTDSVFVKLASKTAQDALQEANEMQGRIRPAIEKYVANYGISKHTFDMKLEKIYRRIFLGTKKRYFGKIVYKSGKACDILDIKGYETRRSDTPVIAKTFLKTVYQMIMDGKARREIQAYIDVDSKSDSR
jgi:DNA polymerase I